MSLSLSVCSQSGPPIFTNYFGPFKGPIRSSDQIFTYFNASAVSRSTKPEIFMSLPLSVLSQRVPQKASGGGGRVVYHTSTGQYMGLATFFLFFKPGVKLDEKSIENGLEGQKFLVVCLFWGGCHHPNSLVVYKCKRYQSFCSNRLLQKAARDGQIPEVFKLTLNRTATPILSVILHVST